MATSETPSESKEPVVRDSDKDERADSSQVSATRSPRGRSGGGWFRRLLFVFLLFVVVVGVVFAAILLRGRLVSVLGEVDSLEARLVESQADLAQTQDDLADTQQELSNLAEEAESERAALEQQLIYGLLLQQAQNQTMKAMLSLAQDDIGQARQEISSLRATLVGAVEIAAESDADTLADLEARASNAEADLSGNAFASQQTLEVIWRELNDLSVTFLPAN